MKAKQATKDLIGRRCNFKAWGGDLGRGVITDVKKYRHITEVFVRLDIPNRWHGSIFEIERFYTEDGLTDQLQYLELE